jgi:hypothetical protein
MKCARCGKALSKAAATIPTQNGALAFGPKCAKAAGLHKHKPRQSEAVTTLEGQLELFATMGQQ